MFNLIDQKIRQAFSDAATQYDMLTSLHKEIGRDLMAKIREEENNETILDVGMGTGWLTKKIAFYFPESKIVGLDFAEGMIDAAKSQQDGFSIIQADANALPFREKTFDLIVSNLSYQWVEDLEKAFSRVRTLLKEEGLFCMTMFGFDTFRELFSAFEHTMDEKKELPIKRLATEQQVVDAVRNAGFSNIKSDYERIKVRYPDMLSLIKWIKGIGANMLGNDMFIGKELLMKTNDYYNEHYKDRLGVYTTFEIIWIECRK